ncbi:hypothetical protein FRB94_012790 [Tulasnella sp. JGI-2019a]|nr:hypothetical protein FRB94_012790 [Tulasnella sp. JGI-2019a]
MLDLIIFLSVCVILSQHIDTITSFISPVATLKGPSPRVEATTECGPAHSIPSFDPLPTSPSPAGSKQKSHRTTQVRDCPPQPYRVHNCQNKPTPTVFPPTQYGLAKYTLNDLVPIPASIPPQPIPAAATTTTTTPTPFAPSHNSLISELIDALNSIPTRPLASGFAGTYPKFNPSLTHTFITINSPAGQVGVVNRDSPLFKVLQRLVEAGRYAATLKPIGELPLIYQVLHQTTLAQLPKTPNGIYSPISFSYNCKFTVFGNSDAVSISFLDSASELYQALTLFCSGDFSCDSACIATSAQSTSAGHTLNKELKFSSDATITHLSRSVSVLKAPCHVVSGDLGFVGPLWLAVATVLVVDPQDVHRLGFTLTFSRDGVSVIYTVSKALAPQRDSDGAAVFSFELQLVGQDPREGSVAIAMADADAQELCASMKLTIPRASQRLPIQRAPLPSTTSSPPSSQQSTSTPMVLDTVPLPSVLPVAEPAAPIPMDVEPVPLSTIQPVAPQPTVVMDVEPAPLLITQLPPITPPMDIDPSPLSTVATSANESSEVFNEDIVLADAADSTDFNEDIVMVDVADSIDFNEDIIMNDVEVSTEGQDVIMSEGVEDPVAEPSIPDEDIIMASHAET